MVGAVNQQQQNRGSVLPQLVGVTAGAAVGGFALGRGINAREVLKEDKFELSEKAGKNLTPEQNEAVKNIKTTLTNAKEAAEVSKTEIEAMFKDGDIPIDKFLEEQSIPGQAKLTKETLKEGIKTIDDEIATLTEQLGKETDATKKSVLTADINAKKTGNSYNKELASIVENAKDGKITKEAYTAHVQDAAKKLNESAIEDLLTKLKGHLPKKFSIAKAGIGAVAGLALGVIVSRLFSSPSQEA